MSKVKEIFEENKGTCVKDVFSLIDKFVDKHENIALSCGSEWLYQNDEGQVDALELVGDILDIIGQYENNEK